MSKRLSLPQKVLLIIFISFAFGEVLKSYRDISNRKSSLDVTRKLASAGNRVLTFNELVQPTDSWTTTVERIQGQLSYTPKKGAKTKKILIADPPWLKQDMQKDENAFLTKCNVAECELLTDVGRLRDAHAVVFQTLPPEGGQDLLDFRTVNTSQVWVLLQKESPMHSPTYTFLNGLVNWTATYRRRSTIPDPYYHLTVSLTTTDNQTHVSWANKTGLVAWAVSNWSPSQDRAQYVQELQKYIKVDIFGKQHEYCDRKTCFEELSRKYRFYLAFENSKCAEYITEKFYRNALRYR